jgi:hypothetical protein
LGKAILLLSMTAMACAQSSSQPESRKPVWGTGETANVNTQFETALAPVANHGSYTKAQFSSGGVGLRNRGTGAISISGVVAPVKAAFVYWAVITQGAPVAANKKIMVQRLSPTPASAIVTVAGTSIGTGPTPCWAGNMITVFRGTLPASLASGNGLYQITLPAGASGSINGEDPWVLTNALPQMEGASIVIVGTGTATQRVVIFDKGIAGKTFAGNPGLSYSLTLPVATTGTLTLFESIGADGQHGSGRTADAGFADESTVINDVYIAGPFSTHNDSDWNGNTSEPLPQLWDDMGHDITAATPSGTKVLNVAIGNEGETSYDCMTPVANVIQEQ